MTRQCLELGLIDEVAVDLVPVVMGRGHPFFGKLSLQDAPLGNLEHRSARRVDSGWTRLVVRHGAAGDPDDGTPTGAGTWTPSTMPLEYPDSHNRAGGTGTDPELFYEGRPDELHLDSVGVFVLNLGDHPEHLEQSEELRRGFHIITPFDGPDCDE
jgi:hypothetical protein